MNLNLSKFKKIERDDKCTTLEHPGGHLIKIAHKGLSSELKKQLEELPESYAKGGKVENKFSPKMDASKPAKSSNTMPGSPTEAKYAYTEPDVMGTDIPKNILKQEMHDGHVPDVVVNALDKKAPPFGPLGADPKFHSPPCINSSCKSYGKSHPNCRCYGGKMGTYGGYAEGGKVEDEKFCDADRTHFKGCEYFKDGGMAGKKWLEPESSEPEQFNMTAPENMQQPQDDSVDTPDEAPAPMAAKKQTLAPVQTDINPAPEQASSLPEKAEAPTQPGPEMQDAVPDQQKQEPVTKVQQFQQHKDNNAQELFPEAQAFQQDLDNGHITPKTYHDLFAEKSTLGKIGTLFGLILGGGGAAVAGQPNALLEMMNKQIDNDLKSQEQSQANKQNYLKINQQNILNKAQAANLTADAHTKAYALAKVQMNYAALHKLVTDTSKLPPGPQRDQAMQQLSILNQTVQTENFNILDRAATGAAFYKTLFGGQGAGEANTSAMKAGVFGDQGKELGQDIENKTIPGIPGRAKIAVPQHVRDKVVAMNTLSDKANDLLKYSKENFATLSPAKRNVAEQKAAEMVNFYNESIGSGVLTEGRLKWLDDQIKKNPTGVVPYIMGNPQRLKEIRDSNNHRKDIMLQSYYGNSIKSQAPAESGDTKTSKSGRPIVYRNGKAYYQ